ncbi:MAG: hypothetical protein ACE5ID_12510, partial [Acidobacteriota bacterium]
HPETRSRFALGGGFFNKALEFPVPFAGLNWFDYDFRHRGQQINAFIAGAANFITWSDPSFFGTRADASIATSLIGFQSRDRFFINGRESDRLEVATRRQRVTLSMGYPLGHFFKLRGMFDLRLEHFQRSDDTMNGFKIPVNTFTSGYGGQLQFNRRGLTGTGRVEQFRRASWRPWGDPSPASMAVGSRQSDFRNRFEDYRKWSVRLDKDYFLRAFQKVRISARWLDGTDQDRFSQYKFSFFGGETRFRGFSGSGLRFDRGLLLSTGYTFNVADLVSFDATLDFARVEDEISGSGRQSHTGFGVAGKFVGPWGFIVQVEYGLAIHSDISEVEGEQEVQLLFLKIF